MRWACVLPASNPTQRAGHACASSFKPSPRCTHTCCPHSGTPARLGFRPVSFSCGITSLSTLVVVPFFTQMTKFVASTQSDFGSPDWIRHAQMRSMMHWLSDSVTLLCCGVSCVVSCYAYGLLLTHMKGTYRLITILAVYKTGLGLSWDNLLCLLFILPCSLNDSQRF